VFGLVRISSAARSGWWTSSFVGVDADGQFFVYRIQKANPNKYIGMKNTLAVANCINRQKGFEPWRTFSINQISTSPIGNVRKTGHNKNQGKPISASRANKK
jgi:hypothetical protein